MDYVEKIKLKIFSKLRPPARGSYKIQKQCFQSAVNISSCKNGQNMKLGESHHQYKRHAMTKGIFEKMKSGGKNPKKLFFFY